MLAGLAERKLGFRDVFVGGLVTFVIILLAWKPIGGRIPDAPSSKVRNDGLSSLENAIRLNG